jgi:hypothetical protein
MRSRDAALGAALILGLSACGDISGPKTSGARLRPELVRLAGASGSGGGTAGAPVALAGAGGEHGFATSDLVIEALLVPITEISLGHTSGQNTTHAPAYSCSGSAAACLVDLASPSFETNLLASQTVTVPVGSYDEVTFSFCHPGGTSHVVYLTARATLDGTQYYTRADGSLSADGPAEPAAITLNGCGVASAMPYAITVTSNGVVQEVAEGQEPEPPVGEAPLRLYFTTEDIAWAAMGTTWALHFSGSCALPSAQAEAGTPYVCLGYPVVAAFLGAELPSVERYATNIASAATLFVQGTTVMGGYLRRSLTGPPDPMAPGLAATGSIHRITPNPNGSFQLLGHPLEAGHPTYAFPEFFRSDHSGTFYDHYQNAVAYTATRVQ